MSAVPLLRSAPREARARLVARDVMTPRVITVRPDTSVKDVASLMLTHHISGLPVVTEDGELVGIVTEADLLYKETGARPTGGWFHGFPPFRRAVDTVKKAEGLTAADLMTAPVISVEEDSALHEIAALMVRRTINRVPVLRAGRLVGIVSRADILQAFTRADAEIAAAVRETLLHDLWVDVSRIVIEVRSGVVYIDGLVERRSERDLVAHWVGSVDGVVAVESRLQYEYDDRAVRVGDRWPAERV